MLSVVYSVKQLNTASAYQQEASKAVKHSLSQANMSCAGILSSAATDHNLGLNQLYLCIDFIHSLTVSGAMAISSRRCLSDLILHAICQILEQMCIAIGLLPV